MLQTFKTTWIRQTQQETQTKNTRNWKKGLIPVNTYKRITFANKQHGNVDTFKWQRK